MIHLLKRNLALILVLLCVQGALAQNLQTPAQFLGYELGEQFTTQNRILDYVHYLAKQSPNRIKLKEYGQTYEGRPLTLAFVASDENLQRLGQIRENNLRQAGLLKGEVQGEQPAIAWLSYNIHGNESVSSEAVMQVLYDLVDPNNPQSKEWLKNTVVVLDPMVNPDGRERYVQWYKQASNRGGNASPYAWEHYEPWPGGRPNHYYFDLNRDWAWQTQVESKQRLAEYNSWLPQVHADFHEMGPESPYYFSPAAKPFHESITPWQRQFQNTIGDYNRQYFDKNNWLYFTRENFDLFYPSYGDTWPTYNGAIGMTYEQGGSGRAGLAYKKEDGDTLTLTDRIAHHVAASKATLQATSEKAEQLKQEFRKYYANNVNNPSGKYKAFVIKADARDAGNLAALTDYLDRQGIQYGYAGKSSTTKGYNYSTGKEERVKIGENDVVISMYQPKSTLVKVLFEPNAVLEDSLTYDITSWSLPYAYGLQAFALNNRLEASAAKPVASVKETTLAERPYAYLARWDDLQDLKFMTDLMQQNVKVRMAEKAFTMNGEAYAPGTLILTRTSNERLGEAFDQKVRELAQKHQVQLHTTATGFVGSGADFGSGSVRSLKMPKVAVLSGEGISPYGFGEVWHYFEQQIGYPITVLNTSYFSNVPLNEFDVLILPTGSYGKVLDEKTLENVQNWVKAGGKLIAMEGAAAYLAGKKGFNLKKKDGNNDEEQEKEKAKQEDPYESLQVYGNREREALSSEVQGSIYRVDLDKTHPLAFGYDDTYFALVRSADTFNYLKDGWNVGVLKKDNYATGYVGSNAKKKLQDALILGTQDMGRGQVVYLADNPLFRGFWQGGKLLFGNAVFLVGQ
ncbi:zinc carboxypeptidase [Pontibacter ummariensis]|uniref:Zinc carboxypeptidase n=1 Tax=Pontibacter ummariensis TaxID=1610492 RepID=A0A239D5S6_9BACT|nr:M14 metallopeptidase family protein [Pontibacter ummariensis]PRY14241.1 zinc carboxypeptidase [Pontibacter ummariensis]SNS27194.1 Zinc carboxypeptidase [Pontibacter ummariensis]